MNVLLVEDEQKIADFVMAGFEQCGITTHHERDGFRGLNTALVHKFDAIVLDINLPLMDGFDVLSELRRRAITAPVVMLSARADLQDKLTGFEKGANDYLTKPFHLEELVVRLRSVVSRQSNPPAQLLTQSGVTLNRFSRRATWHGITAVLTQREYLLLEYLMLSPGQIFSREKILQHVWHLDFETGTNVVDVCIQRLRKKLSHPDPMHPDVFPIESIRGVGYRFSHA